MPHPNTRLLAFPIVLLSGVLLTALRLDAKWTGGSGYVSPCPATMRSDDTVTIRRGEVMQTKDTERQIFQGCEGTQYALDERTALKLVAYPHLASPTKLELLQGRVLVQGRADIKTRDVILHVTGSCEIVHYSWLDEVTITPLTDQGCATDKHTPALRTTARFNTYTADLLSLDVFRAEQSAAAPFYTWAEQEGIY